MLKTMRESFHHLKWTLFAVIIVFILGFVYFSGSGTGSRDVSGVIAQVGGDTISAVDFDITPAQQELLFQNGRRSAGAFLDSWDWDRYLERCRVGGTPT